MKNIIAFIVFLLVVSCKEDRKNQTAQTDEVKIETSATDDIKLEIYDFNGLEPYLNKSDDKIYVVNFWATWCTPCKRELNNIADVYEDWVEETGVKLIAVSIDDSRNASKVAPYVNGKGWEYEVYIDSNQDFQRAIDCLNLLVENRNLANLDISELVEYKVVAEIIKHTDEFKFNVPDDVENFTPYPQGFLIAEDENYNYRVAFQNEGVVFPNPNVPVGQRVAVMVARKD